MSSLFDEMMAEICEKNKQISDLEAKLEESEKKIDKARKQALSERQIDNEIKLNCLKEQITGKEKRITELKQQLAQKDKQLEKLKSENHALISDNAYQEADMFEFNSRIEQLQKQLAESEKDRLMWQEMYKSADKQNKEICETDIYPLQEEITQLKQQLAEKDKEIEIHKSAIRKMNRNCDTVKCQNKISFAVEQFEQLKEWVHNTASYVLGDYASVYEDDLLDEIDNQIKQLKGVE